MNKTSDTFFIKFNFYQVFITILFPLAISLRGTSSQRDENRPVPPAIPPPLPPPPSCWSENRAKFSDVVARNQDSISIFANAVSPPKIQAKLPEIPASLNIKTKVAENPPPGIREEVSTVTELKLNPKFIVENQSFERTKSPNQGVLLMQPTGCHSNSFFMNTFAEPPVSYTIFLSNKYTLLISFYIIISVNCSQFEPELVPYELPETDEPLVELESLEGGQGCALWDDNRAMINLLQDNTSTFQVEHSKSTDKAADLSDALKGKTFLL